MCPEEPEKPEGAGSFKELPPWCFFTVKRLDLGLPVLPAESPPPSLLLFVLFLHLKAAMTWSVDQDVVIGSISWKFWQCSVVFRLSCWVPVCPSQAEWKGTVLNLHKNSKIWYWLFFFIPLFLYFWGISYSMFQRQTRAFSYFLYTCFWGCSFCRCWTIFTHNLVFWNDFP